ncbi:MAG TPA: hypothetical protein DHV89_05825 [Ruminococcus sp.]|nr:hypothetical protein [Ruminococcus sp.]
MTPITKNSCRSTMLLSGEDTHDKKLVREYIMSKEIVIIDENGNVIGSTYPKRAKGLVKNGRAEYVSDCVIKMNAAHSMSDRINTEEQQMSKIIEFDPRKFGFDKSCRSNAGQRAFMTTTLGNAELWEIGDHDKHRTQIISKMKLQRYTDYTFRFAMIGGHNEDGTEISQVNIYLENRWDDRMTFALDKSRYEPVISKRDKTGLLRVFELPFNTGVAEDWNIIITQERAPARFLAPLPETAYSMLGDMSYEQWLAENGKRKGFFGRDTGSRDSFFSKPEFPNLNIGGRTFKKLIDMAKQGFDVEKVIDKAKQGFDIDSVIDQVRRGIDPDGTMFADNSKPDYVDNGEDTVDVPAAGQDGQTIEVTGEKISESELAEKLFRVGSGCAFVLRGCTVSPAADRSFMMIGNASAGSSFVFGDSEITAYALSLVLAKVGEGCIVRLENVTVTDDGVGMMIDAESECGGTQFMLNGVTLPKQALDLIYSKVKNGSTIKAENITAAFPQAVEEKAEEKEAADAPAQDIPDKENIAAEEVREEKKPENTSKDSTAKKEGGYYFTDMLRSTFENAAEGFNTFSAMMRRAEKDINNAIDETFRDQPEDNDASGNDDGDDE